MNSKVNKIQLSRFIAYNGFNRLFQKLNIPFYKPSNITFIVTFDCNLKCKNCESWKLKKGIMGVEDGKKYINQLIDWIRHPFYLAFSGGEPLLLKPDLFEMVKFASTKGILTNITSNGTLINNSVKQDIIDSGLYSINISLDSLEPSVHDNIRGKKGTHKKVMRSLNALKSSGIRTNISTILMAENSEDVLKLVEWVKENKLHSISFQPLQPKSWRINPASENWFKETDSWPKTEGITRVIDSLIKMKKEGYPISNSVKHLMVMKDYFRKPLDGFGNVSCRSGKDSILILPEGQLFFCKGYESLGNLKSEHIKSILNSDKCKCIKKKISMCKKEPCILCMCYFENSSLNDFFRLLRR